jgi:hypothetical protein
MQPYNIKTTKKDLMNRMKQREERNPTRKINPELRKMHEIFGDQNANCGMATKYEDGTCSKIVYDPAKMSFRKRIELEQSTEQPPTEAEKKAERVYKFTHILANRKCRNEY